MCREFLSLVQRTEAASHREIKAGIDDTSTLYKEAKKIQEYVAKLPNFGQFSLEEKTDLADLLNLSGKDKTAFQKKGKLSNEENQKYSKILENRVTLIQQKASFLMQTIPSKMTELQQIYTIASKTLEALFRFVEKVSGRISQKQ